MLTVELGDALMLAGAVSAPLGVAWRMLSGLVRDVRIEVHQAVQRLDDVSGMAAAQIAINAALEHRVARLERVTDTL